MATNEERLTEATELLNAAWGVIANAGWAGTEKSDGWQVAAVTWRDEYHAFLDGADSEDDRSPQEALDGR